MCVCAAHYFISFLSSLQLKVSYIVCDDDDVCLLAYVRACVRVCECVWQDNIILCVRLESDVAVVAIVVTTRRDGIYPTNYVNE